MNVADIAPPALLVQVSALDHNAAEMAAALPGPWSALDIMATKLGPGATRSRCVHKSSTCAAAA